MYNNCTILRVRHVHLLNIKEHNMDTLYSLQDVKDNYYQALSMGLIERMGLDEYIREYYVQTYDNQLDFIGYEAIPF